MAPNCLMTLCSAAVLCSPPHHTANSIHGRVVLISTIERARFLWKHDTNTVTHTMLIRFYSRTLHTLLMQ
uniref:Putative secreted peptide n=1 Tax=Anopheles braziliensis TaxID=58242 RepID=A0A2M3ZVZ5_9DIPT